MNAATPRSGCLKVAGLITAFLAALVVIFFILVRPWYLSWGATGAETTKALPGDGWVPDPVLQSTRAITVQAPVELVWPWLAQLGANRGGWYSYEKLEALAGCPIKNADRIHTEWQHLEPGDEVPLCPPGQFSPPPYIVVEIKTGDFLVLGQHADSAGLWTSTWQLVLEDINGESTRLISRDRSQPGGTWGLLEPVIFVMQRGMLLGIKSRAESLYAGNIP